MPVELPVLASLGLIVGKAWITGETHQGPPPLLNPALNGLDG